MLKIPTDIKAGDIIGFSGRALQSSLINIGTFGIPLWGLSHVGIMGFKHECPGIRLFESVEGCGARDSDLGSVLANYNGRAWLYRLYRPLYLHEITRLTLHLASMSDRPYDKSGALRSAGILFSAIESMIRGQNLVSLFCSEFVASQLSFIGVFHTTNASRWNPNHLMRRLRKLEIVQRPERMK